MQQLQFANFEMALVSVCLEVSSLLENLEPNFDILFKSKWKGGNKYRKGRKQATKTCKSWEREEIRSKGNIAIIMLPIM